MNNLCKNILKEYYKSNIFKFTIIYIIFGILIFTFSNIGLGYINMIYYIMGHPYLISFFLLPVGIFTTLNILGSLNNNNNLVIRFNNRKDYKKFQFFIILYNTAIIFFIFLFITLLFTNLFSDRGSFILKDPYYPEVSNLIGLIGCLIKLYIFLISITLIHITLNTLVKSKTIILMDLLILISFLGYIPNKINWIFPSHYLGYSYTFESFLQSFVYSLIYLFIFFIISYNVFKIKIYKKDFI